MCLNIYPVIKMSVALLIGFKYDVVFRQLPSIIVDLYHAYNFSKKMSDKIIVMTDLITDESVRMLKTAVFEGIVKADIISFITNIKDNNEHLAYKDYPTFIRDLSTVVLGARQIFVYYTGHGENNDLLLPGEQKISLYHFRDIILSNVKTSCQMFSIMDCCNGADLGIPFHAKNINNVNVSDISDSHKIKSNGEASSEQSTRQNPGQSDRLYYKLIPRKSRHFSKQKIIHITSSQQDENSAITAQYGSIFTAEIFDILNQGERDLKKIVNQVSQKCMTIYPQTASLYVSHPNLRILWKWLFHFRNQDEYQIDYMPNLKIFRIIKTDPFAPDKPEKGNGGSGADSYNERFISRYNSRKNLEIGVCYNNIIKSKLLK